MTSGTTTAAPTPLRQLLRPVVAGHRRRIARLVVLAVCGGFAEALVLVLIVRIASALTKSGSRVGLGIGVLGSFDLPIGTMILVAAALTAVRFAFQVAVAWESTALTRDALIGIRKRMFRLFLGASWSVQSREREGVLQELMTTYAGQWTGVLGTLLQGLAAFCSLGALMVAAVLVNGLAAVAVLGAIGLLVLALRPFRNTIRRRSALAARTNLDFATGLTELASTAQEIRIFHVENRVRGRMERSIEDHGRAMARISFLGGILPGVYQTAALLFVILSLGAVYEIDPGSLASLGAIVIIMVRSLSYGQLLQSVFQSLHQSAPYLERIQEQEQRYLDAAMPTGGKPVDRIDDIAFEHVSFEYEPGVPVLHDISFRVRRGEIVGIVGPSGTGKSTLVQLLLRLRQPKEGVVLANGVDVEKLALDDWYQRVTFVPQEPRLYSASVADNIRFFRSDIDDARIEEAARLAYFHEDVQGWPKGYDTPAGERGSQLSGGQKQRLCIARALAGGPDLMVLDEPTSSVDVRSESLIRETMRALAADATVFVIAHRLSTLNICDRIMVLLGGRIEGFDAPEILEDTNPFYQEALRLSGLR